MPGADAAGHGRCLPIGAPRLERHARRAAAVGVLVPLAAWAGSTSGPLPGAWWWMLAAALGWLAWGLWAQRGPAWTGLCLPEAWLEGHAGRAGPVRSMGRSVAAVALGPAWPRGLPLHTLRVVWDAGDTLLLCAVGRDGRVLWGWAQRAAQPEASRAEWQRARRALVTGGAFRSAIFDGPGATP